MFCVSPLIYLQSSYALDRLSKKNHEVLFISVQFPEEICVLNKMFQNKKRKEKAKMLLGSHLRSRDCLR